MSYFSLSLSCDTNLSIYTAQGKFPQSLDYQWNKLCQLSSRSCCLCSTCINQLRQKTLRPIRSYKWTQNIQCVCMCICNCILHDPLLQKRNFIRHSLSLRRNNCILNRLTVILTPHPPATTTTHTLTISVDWLFATNLDRNLAAPNMFVLFVCFSNSNNYVRHHQNHWRPTQLC